MQYRRVRVISGKGSRPEQFTTTLRGIALDRTGGLYAVGDSQVKLFDADGALRRRWPTSKPGHCVAVDRDGTVYVGQEGQVERFGADGKPLDAWRDTERMGLVTAIGLTQDDVLIADVRERCIRRYDKRGRFRSNIGKDNRTRGFLVPNGVLDLAVDADGVIHAANPGKHRVERYSLDGQLLGRFGQFTGPDPRGFSGCCNPTNLTVTRAGHVVVTEKAGPRAKVYDASGKLLAIVADDAFDQNCKNMDVAVDARGWIYVVDTVQLHICVFAPVDNQAASQPASAPAAGSAGILPAR